MTAYFLKHVLPLKKVGDVEQQLLDYPPILKLYHETEQTCRQIENLI